MQWWNITRYLWRTIHPKPWRNMFRTIAYCSHLCSLKKPSDVQRSIGNSKSLVGVWSWLHVLTHHCHNKWGHWGRESFRSLSAWPAKGNARDQDAPLLPLNAVRLFQHDASGKFSGGCCFKPCAGGGGWADPTSWAKAGLEQGVAHPGWCPWPVVMVWGEAEGWHGVGTTVSDPLSSRSLTVGRFDVCQQK